jgi:hypothetical protein
MSKRLVAVDLGPAEAAIRCSISEPGCHGPQDLAFSGDFVLASLADYTL